ncbi:MAG: acyl carrier protein [Fibrobacteres bacterium]|nr:acyl carrier protein [Fibrobacterota bacterium]
MNMANENTQEIKAKVRRFVIDNFLMGDAPSMLKDGESFMETGTIDSTGVLEIVTFLEEVFRIKVDDKDLIPENLDSVDNLARYIAGKNHAA